MFEGQVNFQISVCDFLILESRDFCLYLFVISMIFRDFSMICDFCAFACDFSVIFVCDFFVISRKMYEKISDLSRGHVDKSYMLAKIDCNAQIYYSRGTEQFCFTVHCCDV